MSIPPIGRTVLLRWVVTRPRWFEELVCSDRLPPSDLTYAGEVLGLAKDQELAMRCLRHLARSQHPLVREGVVIGLAHVNKPEAATLLRHLRDHDPNLTIRELAREAIEPI